MQFLEQNKEHVHSLGFGTFDLGRRNPVAKNPEKFGVTAYKNPEWDLALDYYFTVKQGLSIEEVERVFEEFERNHNPGWDLRLFIREYIFLIHRTLWIAEVAGSAVRIGENYWSVAHARGENDGRDVENVCGCVLACSRTRRTATSTPRPFARCGLAGDHF
ncbi:MAG: hypothetical protein MRJ92_14625 [Nitrospira sp.]|nr:hypothetical protein [Nitrospira sp.]